MQRNCTSSCWDQALLGWQAFLSSAPRGARCLQLEHQPASVSSLSHSHVVLDIQATWDRHTEKSSAGLRRKNKSDHCLRHSEEPWGFMGQSEGPKAGTSEKEFQGPRTLHQKHSPDVQWQLPACAQHGAGHQEVNQGCETSGCSQSL